MTTTLVTSWPSANTIIGARATIGIVWLAMTYGTKARSSSPEWTKAAASAIPMTVPAANPIAASSQVYAAAPARNWARL